jgi:exopolyphosphatase/guanosine-5'-triphosphate,3'-diphosphate pyrophosphatase
MYGVIDIGSNTIRLVIYEEENGALRPVLSKKNAAGLAAYVNEKSLMTEEGIKRAVQAICELCTAARSVGAIQLYPFATASLRNIANTDEVLDRIRAECGVDVRLLTGREEALFSYDGAMEGASEGILSDVGGGSTEVVFSRGGEIVSAGSIPLGSLNTYKAHVSRILPSEKEKKAIRRQARDALTAIALPSPMPAADVLTLVGGSARAVLKLYSRDSGTVCDGFPAAYIKDKLSEDDARLENDILSVAPERIHTLVPGMLIIREVARFTCREKIKVSPYGVREGFIRHILYER